MAKKSASKIAKLPITRLTINMTPKEFMKSPVFYTRLDGIFLEHYGIASYPKPQSLMACEKVFYVGNDLVLVKQSSWKIYSVITNSILYDTGITSDILDAKPVNDLSLVLSTGSELNAIWWNSDRTTFNSRNVLNESGITSLAVYQGRVFALKGVMIIFSVPDFYTAVLTNADPFDYNQGAGHTFLDSAFFGFQPKMEVIGDSMVVFGSNQIAYITVRTTPNLSLQVSYYPSVHGDVIYTWQGYVITSLGLFLLKGTKLQPLHMPIASLLQNRIDGGGVGFYGTNQIWFMHLQGKEFSFVFLPVYNIWLTYPQKILYAFTFGTFTFGFDGSNLYKLFSLNQFYPFYAEIDLPLESYFLLHEVIIEGNFGLGDVYVNNERYLTRRSRQEYRRFYRTMPLKNTRFKINMTLEDAIIRRISLVGHAGRKL